MSLKNYVRYGVLALSLSACGQIVDRSTLPLLPNQDRLISDPGSPGPSTPVGNILGKNSYGVTVNRTLVGLNSIGNNHFAQIRSLDGISSPGAYYGLGIGNKGMIGFGMGFDKYPVSAFNSLSFKSYEPRTNSGCAYNAYINFLVDLNCDSLNPNYIVIQTLNLESPNKGVWNTFTINKSDAIFKISRSNDRLQSLDKIVGTNSKACFVAGDVFDLWMKRDQKLAPFQIVHGDSFYSTASMVAIDDITLKVGEETLVEDFE